MTNTKSSNKTILWADDDPDDLMLMQDIIKEYKHQYHIIEVPNGREALKYLQQCKQADRFPCLVILDMNMPILDGKETLAQIKKDEIYSGIPVVMFTTSNSDIDKLFCKKYNVELITKPPEYTKVQNALSKMLSYCNPQES